MTTNGSDGNTLKEFEALLGKVGGNIKDLNNFYNSLSKNSTKVSSGKVNFANSIWFKNENGLDIKNSFLKTNADYYNAAAYKADFNSKKTIDDINNWVKNNTDGLIDKIVDNIGIGTFMFLINTVYFENEWEKPYTKEAVHKAPFQLADGTKKSIDFIHSTEEGYIKDSKAQ
jgi:serpin B